MPDSASEIPAYVAIGSNLGDSCRIVAEAIAALDRLPKTRLFKASSLYRTEPIGTKVFSTCAPASKKIITALPPLSPTLSPASGSGRREVLQAAMSFPLPLAGEEIAVCNTRRSGDGTHYSREQPDFINAVAELNTRLSPFELLAVLQEMEAAEGRTRSVPNAPRTLDLDLLLYGDARINTSALTLPHPRLHLRAFVLIPLAEIAPAEFSIPGRGQLFAWLPAVAGQRVARL